MPPCCRRSASPAWSASAPSSRRCPPSRLVRDWVLAIDGGPLVSLAVATNILAALTGSASGGLTIALDALGATYMQHRRRARHRSGAAAPRGGDRRRHARQPAAQRRGGDACSRSAARPTRESYLDIVMVGIVGALMALVARDRARFGIRIVLRQRQEPRAPGSRQAAGAYHPDDGARGRAHHWGRVDRMLYGGGTLVFAPAAFTDRLSRT